MRHAKASQRGFGPWRWRRRSGFWFSGGGRVGSRGDGGKTTTTTTSPILALHLQQEWAMLIAMCLLTAASLACLYKSSTFSTPAPQVVLVVGRLLPVPLRPLAGDWVWIGLTALWLSRHAWMRLIVLRDDVRSWRPHAEYGGGSGTSGGGGGVGGWLFLTPPFVRRHLLAGGPYLDPPHAVAYPVLSSPSLATATPTPTPSTTTTNNNTSRTNNNRNTTTTTAAPTTTALSTALLGGGRAVLFPHLAKIRRRKSPRRDFWSLLVDGIDTYVLDVIVNFFKKVLHTVWPSWSSSSSSSSASPHNSAASHSHSFANHRRNSAIEDDDDWGDYVLTGSSHHGKGRGNGKGGGGSSNNTSAAAASSSSSSSASASFSSAPSEDARPRIMARIVDRIHRWEKAGGISPVGGGGAASSSSSWLSPPPPHRIISLLTLMAIGYGLYRFHNDSFVFPFRRSPATPLPPTYTYLGGELPSIQVVGHYNSNTKRPPPVQHEQSQLGALAFWVHDGGDNAPSSLLPESAPTPSNPHASPPFFGGGSSRRGGGGGDFWSLLWGSGGGGKKRQRRSSSVLPFTRTRPYGGTGVPSWGRVLFHMIWLSLVLTILMHGRLFSPIPDLMTVPQATRMAWAELQRYRIANSILSATTSTTVSQYNNGAGGAATTSSTTTTTTSGVGNLHSFASSGQKTSRLNRGSRDYTNSTWNDGGSRGHSSNSARLSSGGGSVPVSASAASSTTFSTSNSNSNNMNSSNNSNNTLVESPEERLQLYAQIALLRIVENVLLCAWLPQTELACRATGHCDGLTTPVGEVPGVAGIAGRRDVGTMYQSLVGDRMASFVVALSVVLITELLVASQALTLDRSRLALGAHLRGQHGNHNDNDGTTRTNRGGMGDGNHSNGGAPTLGGAQMVVDEFRHVAREGLANEVGHLSASQGMTLATTLHATHVILVGALWAYYWLMGHDATAMSLTWVASVVAFYGTATAGLHNVTEYRALANELSLPMERRAARQEKWRRS